MRVASKKLNKVEVDKQEEEKCEQISENKENTSQNSEDYLELKDGRKIEACNGKCLKDGLVNQMPISNGLVENEPVTVLKDTACSEV